MALSQPESISEAVSIAEAALASLILMLIERAKRMRRKFRRTRAGLPNPTVQVITGMAKKNADNDLERVKTTHPGVGTNCRNLGFSSRGQRLTLVMAWLRHPPRRGVGER